MKKLTSSDLSRYRRQIMLPGFGQTKQEKLLNARIAIVGAGGLGSPAMLYLAGAGVGNLHIIDHDQVDISNLHRQIIHSANNIGVSKAYSAQKVLAGLNPSITISTSETPLTWHNALELLKEYELIIDGSDNLETRHICSWAATRLDIPHIWGAVMGFDAQLTVFWADHGPIYEDLFPNYSNNSIPSCSETGVLGPVPGVVGTSMAMEAIKIITGIGKPLIGRLGYYSSLEGTWEYLPLEGQPEVTAQIRNKKISEIPQPPEPITTSVPEISQITTNTVLIDVREPQEYLAYSIPQAINVPLSAIRNGIVPEAVANGESTIIYCASGKRSAQAIKILTEAGFSGMQNLVGGIEGWLDKN